jgi:hypothetical protein
MRENARKYARRRIRLTATCVIYGAVPEGSVVPIEYVIEITLSLGFDLDDKTVG